MITCSCHGVSHTTLIQSIAGGLSPTLPVSDLSARLRAGSDCGTCIPDLHKLISEHSSSEFMRSAKKIHRTDRRFLLFVDQKAGSQINLAAAMQRCYVVVNAASDLNAIKKDPQVEAQFQLFGLALDHSQTLYLNEKEEPLLDWLQTLDESMAIESWGKITQGQFRKWNPDKINRAALLRFLVSELMYARQIVEMPDLAGVISIEASEEGSGSQQQSRLLGLPRYNYTVDAAYDSEKWLEEVLNIVND